MWDQTPEEADVDSMVEVDSVVDVDSKEDVVADAGVDSKAYTGSSQFVFCQVEFF